MARGQNPQLPPEFGDGTHLKVTEIFHTIQGEGPYVGRQALFIRLSGCNLACSFCDTDFDNYELLSLHDISTKAQKFVSITRHSILEPLVVITGGEPLRQNIGPLCQQLLAMGCIVQLESNGTIYPFPLPDKTQIVCSPKSSGGRYFPINRSVLRHTIAIKFLISANSPGYRDIAEVGQTEYRIPVYVQPMDELDSNLNAYNLILAQEVAAKHNTILSLQMHKILNIR